MRMQRDAHRASSLIEQWESADGANESPLRHPLRLGRKVNGCLPSPTEGRILPSEYFARLVKRPASSPSMYTTRSRRS